MGLMRRIAGVLGGQKRVEQSADNITPTSGIAPDVALVDVELVDIADARREEHKARAVGSTSAARAPRPGNDSAKVRGALNVLRGDGYPMFTLAQLRREIDALYGDGASAAISVSATVSNNKRALGIERDHLYPRAWRFTETGSGSGGDGAQGVTAQ